MRFNIFLFLVFILASNVQSQDLDKIYKRQANVQSCTPGELNQSEIDLVLKKVNQIRALHKLAPGGCVIVMRQPQNKIDVSHLEPGIYFLKIGDRVEKFVKM